MPDLNRAALPCDSRISWQRVRSEEDWLKVWADSEEEYESGRFFLERLGAERFLDPKLMATLWSLRQRLIAEYGITTAAEMMLLDLALLALTASPIRP